MPDFLTTSQGRRLAYHRYVAKNTTQKRPGIVFLGGFKSDMGGTKAVHLEAWARANDLNFLRFDYSGHGESSERFEDGSIKDWFEDACEALDHLTEGPQILVGSSMGGWISLLLARARQARIAGLVGIAAAPDFTTALWARLSPEQQADVQRQGFLAIPSEYGAPYIFTKRLFEDGAKLRVFAKALDLPFPARFLQGTADADVPQEVALNILAHATGPDITLTLVKDADHRFSTPRNLDQITDAVLDILARL